MPALDGVRGLALFIMLLVHTRQALWTGADPWLARGGQLSVHLFFVLSGFLITTVLLGGADRAGRIRLGEFTVRRIRRLVPVLVAMLAVLAAVAATGTRVTAMEVASTAGYTLTFTANGAFLGDPLPLVTWLGGEPRALSETMHMWTLAVEVQFYALWALLLWAAVRFRWTYRRIAIATVVIIAALAIVRAIAFARGTWWLTMYFSTWTRLDALFSGALVGVGFAAGWLRRPPRWLAPAGLTAFAVFMAFTGTLDWQHGSLPAGLYTVLALVAALSIASIVAEPDRPLARALSWRPLVLLGLVSYSLYIWHYLIFDAVRRNYADLPGPVLAVIGWTASLAVTAGSYLLIERPFMRRRTKAPATAPVPAATPGSAPVLAPVPTAAGLVTAADAAAPPVEP